MSSVLIVKELSTNTEKQDLLRLFDKYGILKDIHINKSQMCAYIEYSSSSEAFKALERAQKSVLHGRKLRIELLPGSSSSSSRPSPPSYKSRNRSQSPNNPRYHQTTSPKRDFYSRTYEPRPPFDSYQPRYRSHYSPERRYQQQRPPAPIYPPVPSRAPFVNSYEPYHSNPARNMRYDAYPRDRSPPKIASYYRGRTPPPYFRSVPQTHSLQQQNYERSRSRRSRSRSASRGRHGRDDRRADRRRSRSSERRFSAREDHRRTRSDVSELGERLRKRSLERRNESLEGGDVRRRPVIERISMATRNGAEEDFARRSRNVAHVKERSVSRDLKITIKTALGAGEDMSEVKKDALDNGDVRSIEGGLSNSGTGSYAQEENERYGVKPYRNGAAFHGVEDSGNILTTGTGGDEFDYEDEANRAGGDSDNESSRSFEFTKSKAAVSANGVRDDKYESKFFSS